MRSTCDFFFNDFGLDDNVCASVFEILSHKIISSEVFDCFSMKCNIL